MVILAFTDLQYILYQHENKQDIAPIFYSEDNNNLDVGYTGSDRTGRTSVFGKPRRIKATP